MISARYRALVSLVSVTVVLLGTVIGHAAPVATPYDLYEAGPLDTSDLDTSDLDGRPLSPWKILQRERTDAGLWLLLALPDGAAGRDLPGWGRPRYLGRVRTGERTIYADPPQPGVEAVRTGRAVTVTPRGGTIRVTREHPARIARTGRHGFQVLDNAGPPPRDRQVGAPEAMRPLLERGRMVSPLERGSRTAQEVVDLVAGVSLDSLEAYVLFLSERESGGPAFRYWEDTPIRGRFKDYIEGKFIEALGPGSVAEHSFTVINEDGEDVEVANIIAKLPSPVPDAPAVIVGAHYDAIGLRSDPVELCELPGRDLYFDCDCTASDAAVRGDPACEWNWKFDPAPGADDNATGVAAMLELARLLSTTTFDFDLYFVAFQAEEIGLVGSNALADSLASSGQEILFVLNMDMLGYNAERNELDVVANETSEWLADWVVETGQLFVPLLPVEKLVTNFGRSDHAAFWSIGVDAVVLLEDVGLPYPGYHQWNDLWETLFPVTGRPSSELQLHFGTQLALASIARFALHYEDPDLAIPAGELEIQPLSAGGPEIGRGAILRANVHNFGTSSLSYLGTTVDTLTARVTFFDGSPTEGAPIIGSETIRRFYGAGGMVPFEVAWTPAEGAEGFHDIHAVVEGLDPGYELNEITATNNTGTATVFVKGPREAGPILLSQYVYPNPVPGGTSDLRIYFELTREARVQIWVWDLEGQQIGFFGKSSSFISDGNQAGANRITGSQFRWEVPDLESGAYLYTIRVLDSGGALSDHATGKFAVVR